MKKRIFLLFLGTAAWVQLFAHVELTYPEGGETFHPGDAVNVSWVEVARHNFLGWHLFFSEDGGVSWDTIQFNMPLETLEYRWTVPVTQTEKGTIRIVQDNEEQDYEWICSNFTISYATGFRSGPRTIHLKLYPNPLIDYSIIEFDHAAPLNRTLTIYDTQGRVVRSVQHIHSGRVQIDRKDLKAGLYFIQLRDEDEVLAVGKLAVE